MNNSKTKEAHDMHLNIEISRTISLAYSAVCKPLCKDLNLPQTAFDILMFLGNNPAYKTASEIVEIRHIKANLVSMYVDRLVKEGFLARKEDPNDRRRTLLLFTGKAQPVIEKGKMVQEEFLQSLFENTEKESKENFLKILNVISRNMDRMIRAEE